MVCIFEIIFEIKVDVKDDVQQEIRVQKTNLAMVIQVTKLSLPKHSH